MRQILAARPGRWTVAFQDTNPCAVAFWRSNVASRDGQWTEERRPVPDRPDLPPDSWISFEVSY